MKNTFILIFIFFFNININPDDMTNDFEKDKETSFQHNFSGVISNTINLIAFDNTALDFYDFTFKFEYQFFKRINNLYKIGVGLSIGDSISPGGFMTSIGYIYFTYNFFNRIHQKVSFNNLVGYNWNNRYALFELGMVFSFINFGNYYQSFYYLTFLLSPYIFIGALNIDYSNISHIIGGFFECSFDIGKYNTDVYSIMKRAYCYISFGIEYRIGYSLDK